MGEEEMKLTPAMINAIEEKWRGRCENFHHGKKEIAAQSEFFCGVMSALLVLGFPDGTAMQPRWVINIMAGRLIRECEPL